MMKPTRRKIIAFDPGEQTGWAWGWLDEHGLTIEKYGFDPWKAVSMAFFRTMLESDEPYDVVVYETWILRDSSKEDLVGSDMQSSQFIGAMKLAVWAYMNRGKVATLTGQPPSFKRVINDFMGDRKWLPPGKEEHARDAIRHLMYYAVFKEGYRP